ncbi:pyroglutamyl peptidase [Streptomyces sp. WMMC1477]|uniref:pyroglutamyl peptidase n=1 Tax=Streptomyces sp. WMMC1477 TaxID=3015155 RepID=UPI0022B6BD25|nr:pyroglutamyl peptidase [Streptomyces sp. WMMC1477]MCZ7433275.1 pyroglutamyl peptidase [Streptomyces sp. WMMC1477]
MGSTFRRLSVIAATTTLACATLAVPQATANGAGTGCLDDAAPLTVEDERLKRAVPQEILRRSGFDRALPAFLRELCRADSLTAAERVVGKHARKLWTTAVHRAQSPARSGELSGEDDRPLYWARLGLATALRQWQPGFPLTGAERAGLIHRLETSSRGQDAVTFPQGDGVKRILVTGFDPFTLDRDIRIGNPSGAAALALDGTTVQTASGPARIEAVVFPVRWRDFADGTVEHTLLPHLTEGPGQVDMFATVSQGRPGQFDIERFNGAWRGGYPDNENASDTGLVPIPAAVPSVTPQPQWTATSLPSTDIVNADTGRFPVLDNTRVTEIPLGATDPVTRDDGPTPGSRARQGGGGNYLSNEIAYRATLLRDALGLDLPGGHVHTPVLRFGEGNTDAVTDPAYERNRTDITAQIRAILTVAAGTL